MQQVGGVYLPDAETHLREWMLKRNHKVGGMLTYQHHKLIAALAHVTCFEVAVDVGAHCGLWSMHLVKRFRHVMAFEPVLEHCKIFKANVTPQGVNYSLHQYALSDRWGRGHMVTAPSSSGDTTLQADNNGLTQIKIFDESAPEHGKIGFVKLDCEGFELFCLRGMQAAIKRDSPVIIVEQKPGKAQAFGLGETDAVKHLEGVHGYRTAKIMSGDYIMVKD